MKTKLATAVVLGIALISGCATTQKGSANHYTAAQANVAMKTEVITLIVVSPATMEVDNSANKAKAQKVGVFAGALLGALGGSRSNSFNAGGGSALGGALGFAVGSSVQDTTIVDGVSITYQKGDEVLTAVQNSRMCEFEAGKITALMTDPEGKSRVQPNATCPVEEK